MLCRDISRRMGQLRQRLKVDGQLCRMAPLAPQGNVELELRVKNLLFRHLIARRCSLRNQRYLTFSP